MMNSTPKDVEAIRFSPYTVGQLLDIIEKYNLPRDTEILIERIEDEYFEKHGRQTVTREGDPSMGAPQRYFSPNGHHLRKDDNILYIDGHY